MRRLNKDVVIQNSWMRYSVSVDAVYCAPCFLFSNDPKEKTFSRTPVSDWKNFGSLILRHTRSGSPHNHCMSLADHFLATELQLKKEHHRPDLFKTPRNCPEKQRNPPENNEGYRFVWIAKHSTSRAYPGRQ